MLYRILREFAVTAVLCLGERMLEQFMFPGLHRTAERIAASDPARADDVLTVLAEAIALWVIVWLFNTTLYAIGFLKRRPLKPQVPMLVAVVVVVLTFAGAYGQWATIPAVPVH